MRFVRHHLQRTIGCYHRCRTSLRQRPQRSSPIVITRHGVVPRDSLRCLDADRESRALKWLSEVSRLPYLNSPTLELIHGIQKSSMTLPALALLWTVTIDSWVRILGLLGIQ